MTSLLEEIESEQPNRICKFGRIIEQLEPDDRAGLEAAIARPDITRISIVNVLARRGFIVDRDTATRHLNGKCVCYR
jgi:hypothetical protein